MVAHGYILSEALAFPVRKFGMAVGMIFWAGFKSFLVSFEHFWNKGVFCFAQEFLLGVYCVPGYGGMGFIFLGSQKHGL